MTRAPVADRPGPRQATLTLVDLLDRLLGTGVVAAGDVVLSVADVDLVYLNLRALVASVQSLSDEGSLRHLDDLALIDPSRAVEPQRRRPTAAGVPEPSFAAPRRGGTEPSALDVLERFERGVDRRLAHLTRVEAEPEHVERGLARLVLTIVDLLRQLMERQALRRYEAGTLTDAEVERLGETFFRLGHRIEELKSSFELEGGDLGLDFGLDVEDLG